MFPDVRTNAAQIKHPIIRPVYMYTGEVPHPVTSTVAVERTTEGTWLRVHPGSPITRVAVDIASGIYKEEAPAWLFPFGYDGPIDLAAIRANPYILGERILSIPAFARYIPTPLRAPGLTYA